MRLIWNITLSGLILILFVFSLITHDFVKSNTERIEKLEKKLPESQVDTVFIINFENKKK